MTRGARNSLARPPQTAQRRHCAHTARCDATRVTPGSLVHSAARRLRQRAHAVHTRSAVAASAPHGAPSFARLGESPRSARVGTATRAGTASRLAPAPSLVRARL